MLQGGCKCDPGRCFARPLLLIRVNNILLLSDVSGQDTFQMDDKTVVMQVDAKSDQLSFQVCTVSICKQVTLSRHDLFIC